MKLAVNYMLAATVRLMGQVFAFGEKAGSAGHAESGDEARAARPSGTRS
jgi:hypothetical protein